MIKALMHLIKYLLCNLHELVGAVDNSVQAATRAQPRKLGLDQDTLLGAGVT